MFLMFLSTYALFTTSRPPTRLCLFLGGLFFLAKDPLDTMDYGRMNSMGRIGSGWGWAGFDFDVYRSESNTRMHTHTDRQRDRTDGMTNSQQSKECYPAALLEETFEAHCLFLLLNGAVGDSEFSEYVG